MRHWPRSTAPGRSSSTACPSTCSASGTRWTASSALSSGPPSATAPSGTSCRADRAMTESSSREPVLVLGCGPVGQTTALLLARWGLDVVVLDGRPERDLVGSKAICQQRDVLDVWDAVGVGA